MRRAYITGRINQNSLYIYMGLNFVSIWCYERDFTICTEPLLLKQFDWPDHSVMVNHGLHHSAFKDCLQIPTSNLWLHTSFHILVIFTLLILTPRFQFLYTLSIDININSVSYYSNKIALKPSHYAVHIFPSSRKSAHNIPTAT